MTLWRVAALLPLTCAVWAGFAGQDGAASHAAVEVTIQQRTRSEWKPVNSKKVFRTDDVIRFQVQSQIAGYLYVLNRESGGARTWLYPRPNMPGGNHISAGTTYLIPDAKGSFSIGGTPGFDVTYWMISPSYFEIAGAEDSVKPTPAPKSMRPRCDGPLRARGDCEDSHAGAHVITNPSELPPAFLNSGGLVSRELSFQDGSSGVRVSTPDAPSGSITYALWIAHQ